MAKIIYQGREIEVVPVSPVESKEEWNVYRLEDGSTLRIKLILAKVFRAVEEKTSLGEPVYITQSQNMVVVDVAPDLI